MTLLRIFKDCDINYYVNDNIITLDLSAEHRVTVYTRDKNFSKFVLTLSSDADVNDLNSRIRCLKFVKTDKEKIDVIAEISETLFDHEYALRAAIIETLIRFELFYERII